MTVTADRKVESLEQLEELRLDLSSERSPYVSTIYLCAGTGCRACGCLEVADAFKAELRRARLTGTVRLVLTGCHGFCEQGPLAVIDPGRILYRKITPADAREIVEKTLLGGEAIKRLLHHDSSGTALVREEDVPFYKHQQRAVLAFNGRVDPGSIDDYIAAGGYRALAKVLAAMSPDAVIDEMLASGLRGRGGGGFPTGRKWQITRRGQSPRKFVICNADEGDPGAYMDRSILEGNPHSVIEGMLIGAYAVGAAEGWIYVRAEYPLALDYISGALDQAAARGLLGDSILGSGFGFSVNISRGAGAFVCGEETALIASIEGRPGTPSPRPPYPAERGLWGLPTSINNVETWANVPLIVNRGARWFAAIGTPLSKGTKVFSLVGKVASTGLVEVPMGMSLRDIVATIGGGVPGGRALKAVQTGGPSGGVIPEALLDLPVDYEACADAGAMMGSGGMIVMDDRTCMVDVARYFMAILGDESCGRCTPCREGIRAMLDILTRICEGRACMADLDSLEELAGAVRLASLCGLGKTAPNPVLSSLRHFRGEYIAHVADGRCAAGVCARLIRLDVDAEKCRGCGRCVKACPVGAVTGGVKAAAVIVADACIRCRACLQACKFDAIVVT